MEGYILLVHSEKVAGKEIEIVINYYIPDRRKDSIAQVCIHVTEQFTIPVTELFKGIPELWEAVCTIVDRVNWTEIYNDTL